MSIPFNDLRRSSSLLWESARPRIERILESGWVVLGESVRDFEAAFADYLGGGAVHGVASGTDAIELSLRALGVGAGSQVGLAANAGYYTSTALHALAADPVFVDVAAGRPTPELRQVEDLLERHKLQALVITHLYGVACPDIADIAAACKAAGVALVEDCSQSHGARRDGRLTGTFGDAAAFSFYPTKNLGALGDGGAVWTRDPELGESVRALRQYGWGDKYVVVRAGGRNSRLDEIQAAVLLSGLERLDEWNERRRSIIDRYVTAAPDAQFVCVDPDRAAWVGHLCVLAVDDRERVRSRLHEFGVATDVHFPVPDHLQPVRRAHGAVRLPNTEDACTRVLSLPAFPAMTDHEVDSVADALRAVLG